MMTQIHKQWPKEDPNDVAIKLLLFLVSPLFGFIYSLKRMDTRSSFIVYFLFALTFGLAFTVASATFQGLSLDGSFYRWSFEQISNWGRSDFLLNLRDFFSFESTTKDFGFEILSFAVSRFTNNYHILFFFLALFFSFFQLKSLRFLTSNSSFTSSFYCLVLMGFFTWNSIFNINGCRFWTSAWIIVYCYFQVFVNGNKRFFFLALVTPIIHASYWAVLALFIIAYACSFAYKPSSLILSLVFILSFVLSSFSVDFIQQFSDRLPEFLNPSVDFYTDEQNLERLNIGGGVHSLFKTLVRITISVLTIILIINRDIISNSSSKSLFIGLLVLHSFANFTMGIPSMGNRFIVLTYPLISYIWLDIIKQVKYKRIIYAFPVIWVAEIYDMGRLYLMVTDYKFYLLSPFYTLFNAII